MRFRLLISLLLLPWSLLLAQTPSKTVSANPGTGELIWPDKETFKLINGIASGMSNPMTAPGDLIVGGIGGAPVRIGIGLPGYVLAVNLTADGLVWIPAPTGGGGGGTGTVTSFSAGALAPLFTTSVATPTTTPALSFSLSSQSANRIFAGPVTGGAAAPTFRALVQADVPDLSGIYLTPAAAALAYVPVTRTVNGHALSGDITVTKSDVGLGNVDNTSDANKPISTATQTALNAKVAAGPITTSGLTMTTARLLGRTTAAAGAVEEISIGAGLSLNAGVLSATGGATGTVTSVALSLPSIFNVTGSPVTTSGTLAATFATQTANTIFAGPGSGAAAAPTFRALVLADVPDLSGIYLTPAAAALAYVPVTRTVNGHALSGDITVTKSDVGLGNVDNTSDLNKPISTATQTALNAKVGTGPVTTSGLTMNTARLLGRTTTAAGAVEEITVSTGLSLNGGVLSATNTNTGTVTSVALSLPSIFSVTGSPVTTSGTLAATFATQAANTIFAGPGTGVAAAPTFRALVAADIPALSYQAPGNYLTALTGDVTAAGPGSAGATLATVTGTVGSFGSSSLIPIVTVNAKGLVTNVTTVAVGAAAAGSLTGTTLASNVVNASLANITPAGGILTIISGYVAASGGPGYAFAANDAGAATVGGGFAMRTAGGTDKWRWGLRESSVGALTDNLNFNYLGGSWTTPVAFTPTGLAVNGSITSTGQISNTSNQGFRTFSNSIDSIVGNDGARTILGSVTNHPVFIWQNGATVAQFSTAGLTVLGAGGFAYTGSSPGLAIHNTSDTSGATYTLFLTGAGTTVGSITRVGATSAVAYNTSSDSRLKKNVRDFTGEDSGKIIDGLKPRWYDWKEGTENDSKNIIGFIAQEEFSVDPVLARIGAVTPGDEKPDLDPKTGHTWMRSDIALVPILVAEVKSLRARVALLEAP